MKKLIPITILVAQVIFAQEKSGLEFNWSHIRENRGAFAYPDTEITQKEKDYARELKRRKRAADEMAAVKLAIINGQFEKANTLLLQARHGADFTRPIQYRYLAIINFIEGRYQQSLNYLNKGEMKELGRQDKVCLLKALNLLILNRAAEAQSAWRDCEKFLVGKDGGQNIWMDALLRLKVAQETDAAASPLKGLNIENEQGDRLRLFLKLALFLNKQETILPRVKYLSTELLENPRTRELLGLLYFRDLQFVKAYDLIEDLSTPNSENLRGNILLAQRKLELAYAQFKLALERKNDSQNALERIVPTAWRLNQWAEGGNFAARLEETSSNRDSKFALEAAFLTKQKRPKDAIKKLDAIISKNTNSRAMEVNQLYAYNSLAIGDGEKTLEYASRACEQRDAFSCWIKAQMLLWTDFPKVIQREDQIFADVDNLVDKFKAGFVADPIQESVYINQKDIEELEDAQIELLPSR